MLEPTTGLEPVNLFLTKEVLYQLSYVGSIRGISGDRTRREESSQPRVRCHIAESLRRIKRKGIM
jgi:hypothetical protein